MLCMLCVGGILPKSVWANTSHHSDIDLRSLQTRTVFFSNSAKSSFLELEPTLEVTSSSVNTLSILEISEHFQSNFLDTSFENVNPNVLYLAAPENLNPGLYVPLPVESSPTPLTPDSIDSEPVTPSTETTEGDSEPVTPTAETATTDTTPSVPFWEVEGLTINLSDAFSNFDQGNRIIEPTVTGTLPNGDPLSITTGFNRYAQPDVNTVFNIPLKAAWTREVGDFTTTTGGGIDLFNRLPVAINLNASTSVPIGKKATLSFFADYGPYKFNATTLNNQIKALRYGPNLYWQITPDMYLFSLVRWGRYNDGNHEQQSFSRLEKKFGDFHIAGNLFTWRYREDAELASGYFSPSDFLVANAEIGWKGEVFEWLACGTAASWGQQRLGGSWSSAYSYNAKCTFEITDHLEMDLGYAFSNVIGQTGGSAFNNRAVTGQVRAKF
ncbi:hypothetical protein DXZ20_26225 [Leptolyngbyaceae cyanobacterium CCMR0081]|uniref:Uncharacterized protein n=1 Tax=Adonisia turfae CCMR0081 TaxID=2292702 RepID=A0A6M0RS61_9CYAN|nr:hypothetical protein [Adonisia turfae CCMR0081]